jgi:hypothetical protein
MRRVGAEYLQEEARLRGARPRVQAVLYPFDLDYGLAPGSGVFDHTAYGGEPGKVVMAAGYYPAGAWTSPVMGSFSPNLKGLVPSWEDVSGGMDCQVYLRTGTSPGEVTGAPYGVLTRGVEAALAPYFQIKVAFAQTVRFWAVDSPEEADEFTAYAVDQAPDDGYESYSVDGETSGYLAGLCLDGRLTLSETEILDPGNLRVELARDFSELRAGDHALVMDNRQGQWLAGVEGSYLRGQDWPQKQLALHQGWELEGGTVAWQLVYQGVLQHLAGMTHGWREPHRARLESQEAAVVRLRQLIGVPSAAGERRPFRRGAYRARGELLQTILASVSEPAKSGSGSATMKVLGAYRSEYPQDYLIDISSSGEVGAATFRWSLNQGQSWEETDLTTAGADGPVELDQGLSVFWESGPGADLVSGDRWTFAAAPPVYEYQVYGAPFETITAVYLNQEETDDRVSAATATGLIQVTGRSAQVEARVVKDSTTHPVDIITDILEEVGLGQAMHEDSFALARSLTPEYVIGVCFENLSAAQAIREIVKRCLYDLWVDFGEIKIRAYLGED